MPLPGFLNDNQARSYPLVAPAGLPQDAVLDFGCLVGLDAGFEDARHSVYLYRVFRSGNTFTFDFRSDAPGLLDYMLLFNRNLDDDEYSTDYAASVNMTGPHASHAALWEGFLVTGPLDALAVALPSTGTLLASTPGRQVEPSLVQNLGRGYLRTINLANQDRTRVTPPAGCPGSGNPGGYDYIVNARNLAGDRRFKEGHNVVIRQNARNNSLAFLALQGAGAGVACDEVPLYPSEIPPDGGSLLGGGPACDEVINSINGLNAPAIRLVPGLGTTIYPAPAENTLVVAFDRHDMTVCDPVQVVFEELGVHGRDVEVIVEELPDG